MTRPRPTVRWSWWINNCLRSAPVDVSACSGESAKGMPRRCSSASGASKGKEEGEKGGPGVTEPPVIVPRLCPQVQAADGKRTIGILLSVVTVTRTEGERGDLSSNLSAKSGVTQGERGGTQTRQPVPAHLLAPADFSSYTRVMLISGTRTVFCALRSRLTSRQREISGATAD